MKASLRRRIEKLEEQKAAQEPAPRSDHPVVIVDADGNPLTPVPANVSTLIMIPDNGRGDATHGTVRDGDLYLAGYAVQSATAICPNCGQKRRWVPLRQELGHTDGHHGTKQDSVVS